MTTIPPNFVRERASAGRILEDTGRIHETIWEPSAAFSRVSASSSRVKLKNRGAANFQKWAWQEEDECELCISETM